MRDTTEYRRVIWLDPGKTTGWASYSQDDSFLSGQHDFGDTGYMISGYASHFRGGLAVGCENFLVTGTGSQRADPEYSLKVIGMVEWLCLRHGAVLLPSVPSSGRNLGSVGGKLKKLGLYSPGKRHANDAAEHLLAWMLREHRLPEVWADKLFAE